MSNSLVLASMPIIDPSLLDIEITIPEVLRPTLAANRHLISRFGAAVVKAIKHSFETPDTSMRNPTKHEVQGRAQLAYEAIRIMYFEEKVSLIQALDILPDVLVDTIRMGVRPGDCTDGRGSGAQRTRWAVPGSDGSFDVDPTTDMNVGD